MNKHLVFEFSVDKENKTIHIKREFSAEVALVWEAYTRPEILDQWWAPKPWKARTKVMDFREGGYWLYAMVSPEGQEHWGKMKYEKIAPLRGFSGLDAFCDADGNEDPQLPVSRWKNTFTPADQRTLVECHLAYDELAQLEEIIKMGFKEGITMAMDSLEELLPRLKQQAANK